MQRASGDERTHPQSTSSRAAVQLVRLYSLAFLLLSIAICYATLRPSSSRFVLLSPTILSSFNFLNMGSDPFVLEKSALESKLRRTYCHKMCLGQPSSSSQQCSLCRLKVKKQSVGDVLSLLGYQTKDSASHQQLFGMNIFPLTWFPQDDGGQVVEDQYGVATPLAAITPREKGGDWKDYRPLEGDAKAKQQRIEWDSAKNMRWEQQGSDPKAWSGDLEGALNDGFLSARELPPLLLHQRIATYCTTRFPESEWQQGVCSAALLERVRGEPEQAHVRLNWDDEHEPARAPPRAPGAAEAGGIRESIGAYVASLCANEEALSAEEEQLLCVEDA